MELKGTLLIPFCGGEGEIQRKIFPEHTILADNTNIYVELVHLHSFIFISVASV